MTERIARLPAPLADAIAAGEVIERPASVVKELCENAVDAGARRVTVAVDGAGVEAVRVVDDGSGIAAEDLRLAVARHATSKIFEIADLGAVRSLGFRGEALASVAAVADVEIVSTPPGAPAGGRLRARAGEVLEEGAAPPVPGTSVTVRDLFFATPARLRFLRSRRAETAACVRAVADLALAHPDIAVSCRTDGRSALRTNGGSLRDACRGVLGAAAEAQLVDVGLETGGVRVAGLVAEPRAHRAGRDGLVVVVNGRRVANRALTVAVEEAYRGLLPAGRHPYGVVVVDLDPAAVDVNVHPAKREVRFRDERAVFAAVQRACWEALRGAVVYGAPSIAVEAYRDAGLRLGDDRDAAADSGAAFGTGVASSTAATTGPVAASGIGAASGTAATTGAAATAGTAAAAGGLPPDPAAGRRQRVPPDDPIGGIAALGPLRPLGQVGDAWLVAESPRGVALVDPHAAHEKVLYAELLRGWEGGGGAAPGSQLLLLPTIVDCGPVLAARAEAHADEIAALGFSLEAFGPGAVRCRAVPVACTAADAERLVVDLLDGLGADGLASPAAGERRHRLAALLACHSAVRLGEALGPAEQARLLERLAATPGGTTCPHGRPTVVLLDDAALRRMFRRPAAG